jgi:hypothetical protein
MTKRTFTTKNNTVFEWEETPETVEVLKQLHETEKKFAGNYPGPLYAPHPDLKNETSSNDKTTTVG